MTSLETVYDAFYAKILDDEWENWEDEERLQDMRQLLNTAIADFKFCRNSLEINEDSFVSELENREIQILATYMKIAWLNRVILTWETIKPLYDERDFSQANLIAKYTALLAQEKLEARRLENYYYRSVDNKPFNYSALAGNL